MDSPAHWLSQPTLLDAARMNAAVYPDGEQHVGKLPDWHLVDIVEIGGTVIAHWEGEQRQTYLSVRGTTTFADVAKSFQVFLGKLPEDRIDSLLSYIRKHCQGLVEDNLLAVGGHSLGGLVALGAGEALALPGLVQNAPGHLSRPFDRERCGRMVEIVTRGDVVATWGAPALRKLALQDPSVQGWDIASLHSVHRQVEHLAAHPASGLRLEDPRLAEHLAQAPVFEGGNTLSSILRSWKQLREGMKEEPAARSVKAPGA